jgi:hypothetical protein
MSIADAGHDGGDVPIFSVEGLAALGKIPGKRRTAALDRRHRFFASRGRAGGEGGDIEPDRLGSGGMAAKPCLRH